MKDPVPPKSGMPAVKFRLLPFLFVRAMWSRHTNRAEGQVI